MSTDAGATRDEVRLSLPAKPEFVRLARITASGLASRLGFTYDEVEDLRLALDELCFALVGNRDRDGVLELRYTSYGDAIEVEGVLTDVAVPVQASLSDLASQILTALVNDHAVRADGPSANGDGDYSQGASIWLRKARAGQTGS